MNLKRLLMKATLAAAGIGSIAAVAHGQDPAQLQALYDDALRQLQQSQDRKNQLADENAKLQARVTELEQQVKTLEASERTYFLRAHYAAWQTFMDRYPTLLGRFQSFMSSSGSGMSTSIVPIEFFDPNWPFSGVKVTSGGA